MRRLIFGRRIAPPGAWTLSAAQHQQLLAVLCDLGLSIVGEARGPVPLLTFGRRVLERLDQAHAIPLPLFTTALKRVIRDMGHERLRVLSPSDFPGVGYVYNAADPETWPVRTSR
jgi:hypothetical protein